MSYEKQTWANGDVITAEKLNHIESGIEGASADGAFIVHGDVNGETGALSVTESLADIKAAYEAGQNLLLCVTGVAERARFAHLYEYDDDSDFISFQLIMIYTLQSDFLINEVIFFYDDGWECAIKNGKATFVELP